jgi:hypothetical protein
MHYYRMLSLPRGRMQRQEDDVAPVDAVGFV